MSRAAFQRAERKRRSAMRSGGPVVASKRQIRDLRDLAHRADMEMPKVVFASDAEKATRDLHRHLASMRQPQLEGFRGVVR